MVTSPLRYGPLWKQCISVLEEIVYLKKYWKIKKLKFILNMTAVFILSKARHDTLVFYKAYICPLHTSVARLHETAGHRDSMQK